MLKAAQCPQQLLVGAACNTPTAAAASQPAARFKIKDALTPKMLTACLDLGPRTEYCFHPHQSRNQEATEGISAPGGRPGRKGGDAPARLAAEARSAGPGPAAEREHTRPDFLSPDKAGPVPHRPDCAPVTPPKPRADAPHSGPALHSRPP